MKHALFLALALLFVVGCRTNSNPDAIRGDNDRTGQNKLSDSTSTRVRGTDFGPK